MTRDVFALIVFFLIVHQEVPGSTPGGGTITAPVFRCSLETACQMDSG